MAVVQCFKKKAEYKKYIYKKSTRKVYCIVLEPKRSRPKMKLNTNKTNNMIFNFRDKFQFNIGGHKTYTVTRTKLSEQSLQMRGLWS